MPPLITIIAEEGPSGWGAGAALAAAAGLLDRGVVAVERLAPGTAHAVALRKTISPFLVFVPATERVTSEFLVAAAERLARPDAPDVLAGRARWLNESGECVFQARPPEPFSLGQLLRLRTRWFDGRCALAAGTAVRPDALGLVPGVFDTLVRCAALGKRLEAIDAPAAEALVASDRPTDENLDKVSKMLRTCEQALTMAHARLGEDAEAAAAEVRAVAERARVAQAVVSRWRSSLRETPDPDATHGGDADASAAAAEYADFGAAHAEGWLERAGAMAAPHLRLAAAEARRRLPRLRRARVLWLCRNSGAGAAGFLAALGARRVEATLAIPGEAARRGAGARLGARRSWVRRVRVVPPAEAARYGPFDLIAVENTLTTVRDPADQLRRWADLLAPRGLLVLAGEARQPAALTAYIHALTRRLCDQVTLRTDLLLDPDADPHVRLMVQEEDSAPGLWARAHPWPRGLDAAAIVAGLGRFAEVMRREYGSVWFHPLTPFPYVEGTGVAQEDAWVVGVWRRLN